MTAANIPLAPSPAATVPPYMRHLVSRAAAQFRANWPTTRVEFPWWAGQDNHYTACLALDNGAIRLQVYCARSGEFVCQSLPGDLFEIDPYHFGIFSLVDEEDREIDAWKHVQAMRQDKRR